MDARIHICNFAPKNIKIIDVRQVLVTATAEYKTHGRFRPNAMDNAENKILSAEKNILMTHYRDSLDGSKIQTESLILCRLTTAVGFQ